MPKKSIQELASIFATGSRPTAEDFLDLFHSFVHKDDVSLQNQNAIGAAIQAYDDTLKTQSANGVVDTLGDVFRVFQQYSDNRKINDELKWSGLPGKPTNLSLAWTQQVINFYNFRTHFSTFDDQSTNPELFESRVRSMNQLRIAALGADDNNAINIVDILVIRRKFTTTGNEFHEIRGVVVGVSPRVVL